MYKGYSINMKISKENQLLDRIEALNTKIEAGEATSREIELFDYLCSLWRELYN